MTDHAQTMLEAAERAIMKYPYFTANEAAEIAKAVVSAALRSTAIGTPDDAREALKYACDLLAERKYDSPARSPGHNARLVIERVLVRLAAVKPEQLHLAEEPDSNVVKSCPFCGAGAGIADTGNKWIICDQCGAEGPVAESEQKATAKWNTRAHQPQGGDAREALKKIIARLSGPYDAQLWDIRQIAEQALATPPAPVLSAKAMAALRNYQQADEDGTMVLVSRQALDEAIAALATPPAPVRGAAEPGEIAWQLIDTAPKDSFIIVYCPEDSSRWLAKWQGGEWYGSDCEHGILRTGHSLGDPNYVTGWFVSHWRDVPLFAALSPASANEGSA